MKNRKKKKIVLKDGFYTENIKRLEITRYNKNGGVRDVIGGFKSLAEMTKFTIKHTKN